eukprot:1888180-Amphidinium_carterae.2
MAEKCLRTRCSNDHSHTRLEGGNQVQTAQTWPANLTQAIVKTIGKVLSEGCRGHKSARDPSHTQKPGECRWADEVEAMSKARAFVPRTSRTRPSGLRREPCEKEPHTEATKRPLHAAGTLATPGEPDSAQEEQIVKESEEQLPEQDETREAPGVGSTNPIPREDRPSGMTYKKHSEAGTQAPHTDSADAPDPSSYDLTRVSDARKDPTVDQHSRKQQTANSKEHLEEIASQMVARIC